MNGVQWLRHHGHHQTPPHSASAVAAAVADYSKMALLFGGTHQRTPATATTMRGGVPPTKRTSPSPECPSFEHLERKQKKPLMEKRRRARINVCYEKLKEILQQSDLQLNSKLEKADILENTVDFVRFLQQQNAWLQHHMHQLLTQTDSGAAFQRGHREGVSIAVTATIDLLAHLPSPFNSVELCQRVYNEVPYKVGAANAGGGFPQQQQHHAPRQMLIRMPTAVNGTTTQNGANGTTTTIFDSSSTVQHSPPRHHVPVAFASSNPIELTSHQPPQILALPLATSAPSIFGHPSGAYANLFPQVLTPENDQMSQRLGGITKCQEQGGSPVAAEAYVRRKRTAEEAAIDPQTEAAISPTNNGQIPMKRRRVENVEEEEETDEGSAEEEQPTTEKQPTAEECREEEEEEEELLVDVETLTAAATEPRSGGGADLLLPAGEGGKMPRKRLMARNNRIRKPYDIRTLIGSD